PVSGLKFRLGKPVPASGDAAKAGPAARQAHTAKTEKKERITSRGAYGGGFWGYQEASGHALALPAPADPGRLRLAANPNPQRLLTARLVQRHPGDGILVSPFYIPARCPHGPVRRVCSSHPARHAPYPRHPDTPEDAAAHSGAGGGAHVRLRDDGLRLLPPWPC